MNGETKENGDYAPQLRVLKDGPTFRKIIQTQYEATVGINKLTLGGRAKVETPKIGGWSAEAVFGTRFKLKWPGLISSFFK